MEEETLAFRSVNRERQGWRSAWPKKPAEPDEWTPPRSWRIRVYYARSRCVSRCVSWAMSARANQWTNSSRVFSPLRHGIQHRRRSLMILCEIVIPIQIGMERNITTNPCFVPISISFSANASTDSRVKIPRLPHRSIFEYFPNRVPDRVRETVVDLLIHLGTEKHWTRRNQLWWLFHSILFFLFPDKSPPTVVFSWLPENLIKLCACFVSTKITELRDSLLSIVYLFDIGENHLAFFLYNSRSCYSRPFFAYSYVQKFSINRNFFPLYIPKVKSWNKFWLILAERIWQMKRKK